MKRIMFIAILMSSIIGFSQVGIGTTTPMSTLDINGNLSVKHVTLVGSATPAIIEDGVYISIQPTINDQDFELPDPRPIPGRIYIIRNIEDTINADVTMNPIALTDGVLFFAGDSSTGYAGPVNMDTGLGGGHRTKSLIFISDGANWQYGIFGF